MVGVGRFLRVGLVIEASLFLLDYGAFDVAYASTASCPCSSLAKQGIAFGLCLCDMRGCQQYQ